MALGILRVAGAAVYGKPPKIPRRISRVDKDLFKRVAAYRTVVMSAGAMQPTQFYLNGLLYLNQTPESIFQVGEVALLGLNASGDDEPLVLLA